jgi:hypothetical protein
MRDHFPGLFLRQPIIHRPVQVVCDLRDLAGGNQRGDCNETPILWGRVRTQPHVAEQNLRGVLHNTRRDVAELLLHRRFSFRLRLLVERKKRRLNGRKLIRSDLTP